MHLVHHPKLAHKSPLNIILLATFLLFGNHCGPSGDEILAEFDGGNITRNELRNLLRVELGDQAEKMASLDLQTAKLRHLGVLKLGALSFDKANMELDEKEKRMHKLRDLEARQLAYTYQLKSDFEDFEITYHEWQFLSLNQQPNGPDRSAEAKSYLDELNKGDLNSNEIEDYIQKKSEHNRYKWIGGYLDPVCLECELNSGIHGVSSMEIYTTLEKTPTNQFVVIKKPNNIIIIRNIDSKTISIDDMEDYLKVYYRKTMNLSAHYAAHADASQKSAAAAASMSQTEEQMEKSVFQISEKTKSEILKKIPRVRLEQLRSKHNFKWELQDPQLLLKIDPNAEELRTILFRIEDKNYTLGNLQKDLVELGLNIEGENKNIYAIINGIIVPREILSLDPVFKNSADLDNFDFFQNLVHLRLKNEKYFSQIKVEEPSAKQISEFYKKQTSHSQHSSPPLSQVRQQIINYLNNQERMKKVNEAQQELSQKYKLRVFTKLLIANKI